MLPFAIISTKKNARLTLATLSMMTLAACGTIQTTAPTPPIAIIGDPLAGRYVPCTQDDIIGLSAPNPDQPGVSETAANVFDTPDTISAIRRHNAKHREACGK